MSKKILAEQLISNFGKMLTLPDLKFDETSNSCILLFDDDLVLNVEYDEEGERLVFSIFLCTIPEENCEALLRTLLSANLYWSQTRGATLSLEQATNGIILAYARNVLEMDGTMLETIVENLLNQAEIWRKRIKAFENKPQAEFTAPGNAVFG